MKLTLFSNVEIDWNRIIYFKWFKRLYILYIFGCVFNLRLSSPFFYEFLLNSKSFSKNVTDFDILPTLFYSTSVQLIPVFLLMEFLKYSPFIIIATLTGIVATCLYIWTDSLVEIQVAQAFYGSTAAAEVAYFISIYAHSDEKTHQRLTAYVRAAPLLGKVISSLFSQLFISDDVLSYKDLYYFDLAVFIVSTILTIFLPPTPIEEKLEKSPEAPSGITSIWWNLKRSYPNKYVVKWSIWSMLTICGFNQMSIYIQPFWHYFQQKREISPYNGALEGVYALFGLVGTILGGVATFNWKYNGDLILSMTSLVQAFMLLFMSQIDSVILNCLFYIIIGFMYHFIMTIVCAEIAKFLPKGCFGLVFGLIALIGSLLSTGFVVIFNANVGLKFDNQDLFMMYGFYHLGVSIIFIIVGLTYWFAKHTYQ